MYRGPFWSVPDGEKEQLVSEFGVFSSHPFQDVRDSSRILGSESLSSQTMRVRHGLF